MPTSESAEQAAAVEHADLVDVIVQTSFATMAVLNRVAAEHDLSLTQLRVLAILRDRRLRMTELARYLGLDKSTMTGLVDRAEKRGLLTRARDPADGRVVDVFLSADGARAAERGHEQIARLLAPMTSTLSRADQHRVQALLAAMLSGRPAP
jgi:DNA-binding MarR family transcriptional regulator